MELLRKQVTELAQRVDALYQVIERLDSKVSGALSEQELTGNFISDYPYSRGFKVVGNSYQNHRNLDTEMEHKDVLVDANYLDTNYQGSDQGLTPELQIQRLTAQLTAAYNRIAALEEQLLSRRVH